MLYYGMTKNLLFENTKSMLEDLKKIEIQDYFYPLQEHQIAQFPLINRDSSKLLLYRGKEIEECCFRDVPNLLSSDKLLVFNVLAINLTSGASVS